MTRLLCLLLCLLGTTAHAQTYRNCGQDWTLPHAPPQRILALNQHAADLLLALQVGPSLVAVSYIDDDPEALASRRYRGVPLLSRLYPSPEVLYAQRYDLVVGGFASAFRDGVGARTHLTRNGIGSYLLENACDPRPASGFAAIEDDLRSLGKLLQRESQAARLIAQQRADLDRARQLAAQHAPLSVFYLDSEHQGLDSEGSRGFITQLIQVAGGRNLFADVDLHRVTVDPETLLQRDPDVIILADAVWSPARRKREYLHNHPALSKLRAVREDRLIDLPFTHLVAGEHSARAAVALANQLRDMAEHLP